MMKTPTDGLGPLLHTSARLLRRRFELRSAEHGLSSAQWRMLLCLFRTGPSSQARLAEWLEIEPISVSRMIDRMAQSGWVERVPDPADRRIKQVAPTDKALNIFKNLREMADAVYGEALVGFTAAEQDLLLSMLTRLTKNLSETADPTCGPTKSS